MKCMRCGRSPEHDPDIALIRQNEKGETGIWACETCNQLPLAEDLAQAIAAVQRQNNPTLQ